MDGDQFQDNSIPYESISDMQQDYQTLETEVETDTQEVKAAFTDAIIDYLDRGTHERS